jgi:N-acetyl-gamma-glutamyl-phosphate reductase
MSDRWPVIVLGGSGYVAGEMVRLVCLHPRLKLAASVSTSQAGEPIAAAFAHLAPVLGQQRFVSIEATLENIGNHDHWVVLSAAPHGASAEIIAQLLGVAADAGVVLTVVDASADFRFRDANQFAETYGKAHPAPELLPQFTCAVPEQLAEISTTHAAQPGCFATSMLLGIVPLAAAGLCTDDILVSAVTGSTGAGRTARDTTHHPVRQSNLFAYQPLEHRHETEVRALTEAATGRDIRLSFVPHSGPFARGIHATIFARPASGCDSSDVLAALSDYYANSRFVKIQAAPPRMKDIAGSNYACLSAHVRGETIVVCSVIDNLLKGAAGGSIQWVNRLLGLEDWLGVDLPAQGWAG